MAVDQTSVGRIAVLQIANPPVNALGARVRKALAEALFALLHDAGTDAIVISGNAKAFSAGADIREFGKPRARPVLRDLLLAIEGSAKPVVAAIEGFALGGGLELALACHARVAGPGASFALPEVTLGIIPGAGGTQRLPPLVGLRAAADMITTGKRIDAARAQALGIIDRLCEDDVMAQAVALARALAEGESVARAPRDEADFDADAYGEALVARARGRQAPIRAFEAVLASRGPLDEGLATERALFEACMASEERAALVHVFQAERAAAHSPFGDARAREVSTIGVLGAGTMGAAIAIAALGAGYAVALVDSDAGALAAGRARIEKAFGRDVEKGRRTREAADAALSALVCAQALDAVADCHLVIEAIIENLDAKRAVFEDLARSTRPGTVLASNTSYLPIDSIARGTRRERDMIGMHFFSPANVMKLLEIVCPQAADPDALATAFAVGRRMGKTCVPAGVCDGFIGNRIFKAYREQAEMLVEDGALPHEVDRAMRDFGFAMGPFEVSDLAGLDIGYANRRREDATRDPARRYVAIGDRLFERGRLGQKTGAGWYAYDEGDREARRDPEVEAIIEAEAARNGIERRAFADGEIRERLLLTMINEGARILSDGIARRPSDIDLVLIYGYGFPAHRGGPMFLADAMGTRRVLTAIERFSREDPVSWSPAPLVRELAERGESFSALNRAG